MDRQMLDFYKKEGRPMNTEGTNIISMNPPKIIRGHTGAQKGTKFKKLSPKPVFVHTKNVRNFETMMDFFDLSYSETEGSLGMVYSRAGRGKTRTAQWYAAHNGAIYLRSELLWSTSHLGFLQALCRELEIVSPSGRKTACFYSITDKLLQTRKPVFIDEIEKLPKSYLELIRDITDLTGAPFILIGEEELVPFMQQNRRIWSRCFYQLKFEPLDIADVTLYFRESINIDLDLKIAKRFLNASEGDFRLIRRYLIAIVQILNANETYHITEEMAKIAIKTGLEG